MLTAQYKLQNKQAQKHYEVIVIVIARGLKYRRKIHKNVNEKQIHVCFFKNVPKKQNTCRVE